MCEAIKESRKHNKKNVLYARLLYELFHQSRLIEIVISFGASKDREETYENILLIIVLGNMNINNKRDVIQPPASLMVKNDKIVYITDFPTISKFDNPGFI